MATDWHERFKAWSKPPSETEEDKGSRAAKAINDAVREDARLASRDFEVYATGSYRNNTNVRLASDIDVAIVLRSAFFYELPAGGVPTRSMLDIKDADYAFVEFRDDIQRALVAKFGQDRVKAGDKTFNIHESSRSLDADATVFTLHRRYTGLKDNAGQWAYDLGVGMCPRSDPSKLIVNWHEQHYTQGVARNDATRRRFKRITRILKRLRDEMRESGTTEAKEAAGKTSSFLIECLVFNASDGCFNREDGSYYEDVKACISQTMNATSADEKCKHFTEVSRMKILFAPTQPWTRAQAHEFLLRAWQHVGFKSAG